MKQSHPTPSPLGVLIREGRRRLNLHRTSLADKAQVATSAITNIELGHTRTLRQGTLESLAQALGMPLETLEKANKASAPQVTIPTGEAPLELEEPLLGEEDDEPAERVKFTITVEGELPRPVSEALDALTNYLRARREPGGSR